MKFGFRTERRVYIYANERENQKPRKLLDFINDIRILDEIWFSQ